MKKAIGFILTIILLISTTVGCAVSTTTEPTTDNDYEKAKDYVISYANAVIKAWNYGFNDDCIFENEAIEDTDSPENVDLNQLAEVTGFERTDIENVLHRDHPEFSYKTVVKYCNTYYILHQDGTNELETYNILQEYNGKKPQLDMDEYWAIMYNLEMIKHLFENIGKDEYDGILAQNGSSNEKYQKLTALYEYTKTIHATCLDNTQYKFLFPDNFDIISQEIQVLCTDIAYLP